MMPSTYAISIKDDNALFLMFKIVRSDKGDYYVNFNEREEGHNIHSSYHQSGYLQHKSYGKYTFPVKIKQSTANFVGTEVVIATNIRKGDGRIWGVPCEPREYADIMVIEDNIITPQFGYSFEVEIVEPGANPWISTYPFARVIQQQTFKSPAPWIVATLYEMHL